MENNEETIAKLKKLSRKNGQKKWKKTE